MKKTIGLMFGVMLSLSVMAAEWYDETTGFTWYYSILGDAATLTGCSPKEGQLPPLPSVLGGKTVKIIKSNAFYACSGLTGSLTIPDSVTAIENDAFYGCSGFTGSLTIPNSLTTIGASAFSGCSGFNGSLTIPDSVTTIELNAFLGCSGFTGLLTIPDSVTTIGKSAFSGCSGFTGSLTIPDSVTTIGDAAFYGCSGFTGSLTIPNSLTTIGNFAFSRCSGFTGSLTIPDSVTTIGDAAFNGCSGFTGSLTIPDSVTSIGSGVFMRCSGFTGMLIMGNNVTTIGSTAFSYCKGLTGVVFKGLPPNGFDGVLKISADPIFPEKYAAEWKRVLAHANLREPMRDGVPVAKVISAKMRANDPTIMDVVYKVSSSKPTVKVRTLAFQDGERSFAKVIRPETFVADENGNPTAGNIGDGIKANEEHTLSWKVSADWDTTLAKVNFEVLAVEDEILPLELVTLTKTETQPKMMFSWNYVIPSRAFDALLWLYADKDQGLTLTNGVLKNGDKRLADGTSCDKTSYDALVYIYGKMGYELLQGERLNYVRERSRLDLPDVSVRQYAVKVIEE